MRGKQGITATTWLVLFSFLVFCFTMGGILASISRAIGGSIPK